MSKIEARLKELGLTLPEASAPIANYVPFTVSGKLVYVSGQVPRKDGKIFPTGRVGHTVSVEDAQKAAQNCMLSIIAHAKTAAGGNLDNIARVLRVTGYVHSASDFGDQPAVINGASDCAVAVFGEAGRHARSAVGVSSLPAGASVEVEAILELV